MYNIKQFSVLIFFIQFLALSLCAQVDVSEDKRVGIGGENLEQAKTLIKNNEWDYSLRVVNSKASPTTKYAIFSYLFDSGSGEKRGIYNQVYNNKTATTGATGLYNQTSNYGSGTGYGIHNTVNQGTGHKYGIFSSVTQTSNSNQSSYGVYNQLYPRSGRGYGVYNYLVPTKGGAIGTYNNVLGSNKWSGLNIAGSYSEVRHFNLLDGYGSYIRFDSRGTIAKGQSGKSYGLYVDIDGPGDADRIGVFSDIRGGKGYAGKFIGDVHVDGALTWTSDESLKQNIKPVSGALSIINKLSPKTYTYKKVKGHGYKLDQKRYGFLAGELESVLPTLVQTIKGRKSNPKQIQTSTVAMSPIQTQERIADENSLTDGADAIKEPAGPDPVFPNETVEDYKAINYIDLIPILTQAIKDQQAEINLLRKEIENLKK